MKNHHPQDLKDLDGCNDCDEAPIKRSRTQNTNVSLSTTSGINIPWPMLYPKPSVQQELEMEKFLIMNRYESGRGTELPMERQQTIEREAFHRGFLLT
jgi:hypothetical protein